MAKKTTKSVRPVRQKRTSAPAAGRRKSSAKPSDTHSPTPTADDVAVRAYYLFLERGYGGNELDDWLRAEREVIG
jgi:hypothetical protein